MPKTPEEHITYTRNEFFNYKYYVEIFKYLTHSKITSYIDIGANTGEVCNIMFELIPSLQEAYLIEPEEYNFQFMQKNVKNKNCKFFNCAIGYNYKNPNIISHSSGNIGEFMLVENSLTNESNTTIRTLEELNIHNVDLIKIDIEGGEYNLIENSSFLKTVKFLEIEFHDYENNRPLRQYIKKYLPEYTIEVIEDIGGRCLLKKYNYDL